MAYIHGNDFRYRGFSVSRYNLIDYLEDIKASRGAFRRRTGYQMYGIGLAQSIIAAIADNDFDFNPKDQAVGKLLEDIIKAAGYDSHGVYAEDAHAAMRNLRQKQGKNPDDFELHDKTLGGLFGRAKSKVKSLFGIGRGKSKEAPVATRPTPEVAPTPVTSKPAPKPKKAPTAKQKSNASYKITLAVTGLAALGTVMYYGSPVKEASENTTPTFKTISVGDTTHNISRPYNVTDGISQKQSVPVLNFAASAQKVTPSAPKAATPASAVATDSVSVRLTRASKSALDILLGAKKSADLCRRVQSQIDAGIFVAPNGMSAERIAHAMTMSRIYEGKSVILDALNSKTKLTPAQQAAFAQHIDDIGDLGVKLQKRMASQHKLSRHSKYDKASKSMQKVHIKNVKQLKQVRAKLARTR